MKRPHDATEPLVATCSPGYSAEITEIDIPALAKTGNGTGWGSELAVRIEPPQLFWSRTYGLSPVPWSRFDVETGHLLTVKGRAGVHGDLRDSVLDDDGRHAWFLLTGGLARVDLAEVRVVEVLRVGLPRYLSRLFALGDGLLAATGWTGGTVTIVDGLAMRIVKTIRMPSPDAVVPDVNSTSVELLSFNGSVARRLDLGTLALDSGRSLPRGAGPFVTGGRAWIVVGKSVSTPDAPKIRRIAGVQVAEVEIARGEVTRKSMPIADPIRVVGLDAEGNVLVRRRLGVTLLDHRMLTPAFEVTKNGGAFGAVALLPDLRSAAVLPNWLEPERLAIIRWDGAHLER